MQAACNGNRWPITVEKTCASREPESHLGCQLSGQVPIAYLHDPFVLFFTRLKWSKSLFISEESFACKICSKTFAYRQNMLKHRRRHTTNLARPPHGGGRARPIETSQCKKIAYGVFVIIRVSPIAYVRGASE